MTAKTLAKRPRPGESRDLHGKNHKFESFSQRVSRFKVDPLRRGDRHRDIADGDDSSTSYFRTSLEEWQELNLSENFTSFAQKVDFLCDSLVQILHHQDAISILLLEHVRKGDKVSLEPLLSLVAHFAHDLGPRFERYFEEFVSTIASIAAKHEDVEVIEWSFNCLAWLFKYLARLLVPDLRPLLRLMAPFLGKERQRSFVTRFAAESQSFLLRKAASAKDDAQSLHRAVEHVAESLKDCPAAQSQQYESGLATLFAEAVKGVQRGLHSSGATILKTLTEACTSSTEPSRLDHVLEMVLISTLHNTNAAGFEPGLDTVLDAIKVSTQRRDLCERLLFVIIATRKGTRVLNWERIIDLLGSLLLHEAEVSGKRSSQSPSMLTLRSAACVLQYAPLTFSGSVLNKLVKPLNAPELSNAFLQFCICVADIGQERFESLLKTEFQRFIVGHAREDPTFQALLPRLRPQLAELKCPPQIETEIVQQISLLKHPGGRSSFSHRDLVLRLHSSLSTLQLFDGTLSGDLADALESIFHLELDRLAHGGHDVDDLLILVAGKILQVFVQKRRDGTFREKIILKRVFDFSQYFRRSVNYLEAIQALTRALDGSSLSLALGIGTDTDDVPFIASLVENLAAPSKDVRCLSLEILIEVCNKVESLKTSADMLETALSIERLPLLPESSRSISAHIKSLGNRYQDAADSNILRKAIPAYAFGILSFKLSSAWDEACTALETMSHVKGSDELIMTRLVSWLTFTGFHEEDPVPLSGEGQVTATQWQCTNILQLDKSLFHLAGEADNPRDVLLARLKSDLAFQEDINARSRTQALKVLESLHQLTEKRSRLIVPVFLRVFHSAEQFPDPGDVDNVGSSTETVSTLQGHGWSKKNQLTFMSIFSKFSNPSVLYRSDEVFAVLMEQLCMGDADTQRHSLKAIFAWKHSYIKPYEEHLLNILDANMFREELSVFLSSDEEESTIQLDHQELLMPVIVRLLYGRAITRSKAVSSGRGQAGIRKTVLHTIARFSDRDVSEFLKVMLGPLDNLRLFSSEGKLQVDLKSIRFQPRRQLGLLRMIEDVLDTMSNRVKGFIERIADAVMFCALQNVQDEVDVNMSKSSRQSAIACLDRVFQLDSKYQWQRYIPSILEVFVDPRLEKLPEESSQGISALMRLFSTWAASSDLAPILHLKRDKGIVIERIADCLAVTSVTTEVLAFILNKIITITVQSSNETTQERLKQGLGSLLICRLQELLGRSSDKALVETAVDIVIKLRPYIAGQEEIAKMIHTALGLLTRPPREISPRVKSQVLELLGHFVSEFDFTTDQSLWDSTYETLSSLFSYFQDTTSRRRLCSTFMSVCLPEPPLLEVAEICQSLNAVTSSRLGEPDFEKRLQGFRLVNEERWSSFSPSQWLPVLHNALFLIRDDKELAMRTSASLCLQRFIGSVPQDKNDGWTKLRHQTVIPALEKGMRETSELIRAEFVAVVTEGVRANCVEFDDMKILLGNDEESGFFNNILHIQQHRRTRALRRLTEKFQDVGSANLGRFCISLVEQYLVEGQDTDHNLATEAINCLEKVAAGLEWQKFRALLHKYAVRLTPQSSRLSIRTLSALVNCLGLENDHKIAMNGTLDQDAEGMSALRRTLPNRESVATALTKTLLPKFTDILHYADEATVDTRVLIAPAAVKVILTFPEQEIASRLPAMLIDVCNILKARAQDARDSARKALTDISTIIGPQYFGFVLRQLRNSLQRGYQLHVLAYTVHSILVPLSARFKLGELDYCLDLFMNIIVDEIFGVVGQEKDSEDFISRMKEVKKKNLGYDSLEILATLTSIMSVSKLILPLKTQLDKPRPRIEKVDECLRRVREGLRRNPEASTQQALSLCFELMNGSKVTNESNVLSLSQSKLAIFGADLLRRVVDKHEQLKTPQYMSGFVSLLIGFVKADDVELRAAAMRSISTVIKLDIAALDIAAPDLLRTAKRVVEEAPSTNNALAQTAIRLASSVLRERPNAVMKQSFFETHISYILTRIKPDLREPAQQSDRDRQVAAFNFIRAVMSRGVLVKEVYEVMDVVREVMISSREVTIPELSRSAYSRFLVEYFPDEGKGLSKQVDFLVNNLQYPRSEGRQSIMEVIMFLVSKKSDEKVQPILVSLFLPLVLVLAVDDAATCRSYASVIIKKMFERSDRDRLKVFKTQLSKWLQAGESELVWQRISFQCWDIFFDVNPTASKDTSNIFNTVSAHLTSKDLDNKLQKDTEQISLAEAALVLLKRFCTTSPSTAFASPTAALWTSITTLISTAPPQLKTSLVQLTTNYLTHFARHSSTTHDPTAQTPDLTLPLSGPHGLTLTEASAWSLAEHHLEALASASDPKTTNADTLAKAATQNLAFLARTSPSTAADLLTYAADQLKRDDPSQPPLSRLHFLALLTSLCRTLPPALLTPSLPEILSPLQNLTDASIPQARPLIPTDKAIVEQLTSDAQTLLLALQAKVGASDFIAAMADVQRDVRERREERRTKRDIERVVNPEGAERKRVRRHESSKGKRRERNKAMAGMRRGW